jgi:hypothetical protein
MLMIVVPAMSITDFTAEILTVQEIQALTGRTHRRKQMEVLEELGISYRAARGRVVVLRGVVEDALASGAGTRAAQRAPGPNFEALRRRNSDGSEET